MYNLRVVILSVHITNSQGSPGFAEFSHIRNQAPVWQAVMLTTFKHTDRPLFFPVLLAKALPQGHLTTKLYITSSESETDDDIRNFKTFTGAINIDCNADQPTATGYLHLNSKHILAHFSASLCKQPSYTNHRSIRSKNTKQCNNRNGSRDNNTNSWNVRNGWQKNGRKNITSKTNFHRVRDKIAGMSEIVVTQQSPHLTNWSNGDRQLSFLSAFNETLLKCPMYLQLQLQFTFEPMVQIPVSHRCNT